MKSTKARDLFAACAWTSLSLMFAAGVSGCGAQPATTDGAGGGSGTGQGGTTGSNNGLGGNGNGAGGGSVIVVDAGPPPLTDARKPSTSSRYIPLVVGAVWTWKSSDPALGLQGTTGSTIEALDTLTGPKAGVRAYRVRSTKLNGATINWQEDTGTAIVRHREQFLDAKNALVSDHYYTPSKLRLDESPAHTTLGAAWTETFTDQATSSASVSVAWTVEAVDETVTVPAGTFKCLRVHAVETGAAGYDSHFWYARGVGKVKETGTEVRDLTGYNIP